MKRDLDDGAQQRLVRTVLRLKLATAMLERSGHPAIELVREGVRGFRRLRKENYVCSGAQTK